MNNQALRRIPVEEDHYLYQSNRHLENNDHSAFEKMEHISKDIILAKHTLFGTLIN